MGIDGIIIEQQVVLNNRHQTQIEAKWDICNVFNPISWKQDQLEMTPKIDIRVNNLNISPNIDNPLSPNKLGSRVISIFRLKSKLLTPISCCRINYWCMGTCKSGVNSLSMSTCTCCCSPWTSTISILIWILGVILVWYWFSFLKSTPHQHHTQHQYQYLAQ